LSKEGKWEWTDGSKWDFAPWGKGQPDNAGKRENCLEENWSKKNEWNDNRCNQKKPFVCQRVKGVKAVQVKADFQVYNPAENMRTYSTVWGGDKPTNTHRLSMLDSSQGWSA